MRKLEEWSGYRKAEAVFQILSSLLSLPKKPQGNIIVIHVDNSAYQKWGREMSKEFLHLFVIDHISLGANAFLIAAPRLWNYLPSLTAFC